MSEKEKFKLSTSTTIQKSVRLNKEENNCLDCTNNTMDSTEFFKNIIFLVWRKSKWNFFKCDWCKECFNHWFKMCVHAVMKRNGKESIEKALDVKTCLLKHAWIVSKYA